MPNDPKMESFLRKMGASSPEELWHRYLTEGDPQMRRGRHIFALMPSNPRCAQCNVPFAGIGGMLAPLMGGGRRSTKNPRYCNTCLGFLTMFQGGTEVELSMLFVDVRGSTTLAESMSAAQFSRLMNRFYEVTINVLIKHDAMVDKLVGDEVTALFLPGYAGSQHAGRAVETGQELLRVTGHADAGGPWIPVGVGVHTGVAWVGAITGASGAGADFTALGDNVNIAARLASRAGAGEVLVSEAACQAAGLETEGLEERDLELKGRTEPVSVRVLHAT